jgi:NAD(P)-dependent dehydrogenase (short-subunit alcohol dehydrogenase family)
MKVSAPPAREVTMQGKVCLVTGATSGIGEITARELARLGAHVAIVGRSAEKCATTVAQIKAATGATAVDSFTADLSARSELHRLAQQLQERLPRLDVVVNNAGAMFWHRTVGADGIEKTLALNHFSYFVLTSLLLPLLRQSAPARIVNVASDAHKGVTINFDDIEFKERYSGWKAYQQSKLANILFTYELARRLEGTSVTANTLHPGFVRTNFLEVFKEAPAGWLLTRIMPLFAISPEEGARTSIYLASAPEVEKVSGRYFVKQKAVESSTASRDRGAAERLWQLSEAISGVKGP